MGAALSARQQAIVDRLSLGRASMAELVEACGYTAGWRDGNARVSMHLTRLGLLGYVIVNERRAGSHRGGYYTLMSRPREQAARRFCIDCGGKIAAWNEGDRCSSCQSRFNRLAELPWPRLMRLPLELPPTVAREKVGA